MFKIFFLPLLLVNVCLANEHIESDKIVVSNNQIIENKKEESDSYEGVDGFDIRETKNDEIKNKDSLNIEKIEKVGTLSKIEKFFSRKRPFYEAIIFEEVYEISPYVGVGYTFFAGTYSPASNQGYSNSVPNIFNNAYLLAGTKVGQNLFFEIGGSVGGQSYTNSGNGNISTMHIDVGWIFGEEMLGEYGKKNKIIVLAGVVLGFGNIYANGYGQVASNSFSVAPELGLAYQRYIFDRLSVRLDARISSIKPYDANGSVMGIFIASAIFHI